MGHSSTAQCHENLAQPQARRFSSNSHSKLRTTQQNTRQDKMTRPVNWNIPRSTIHGTTLFSTLCFSHLDSIGMVSAMYRRFTPRAPPRPISDRPTSTSENESYDNACHAGTTRKTKGAWGSGGGGSSTNDNGSLFTHASFQGLFFSKHCQQFFPVPRKINRPNDRWTDALTDRPSVGCKEVSQYTWPTSHAIVAPNSYSLYRPNTIILTVLFVLSLSLWKLILILPTAHAHTQHNTKTTSKKTNEL